MSDIMKERKRWGFLGLPFTFTTYTITEKKLLITKGLMNTKEDEILLYKILDMQYSSSFFQKMFGLGTVKLFSQDVTNPELEIKNIKHSRDFRDKLSDLSEQEKQRLNVRRGEGMGIGMPPHSHHDHDLDNEDFCDDIDVHK